MITLTREEAQQVLDALTELNRLSIGKDAICLPAEIDDAMEILRARLAQPEPEPVTKCTNSDSWNCKYCRKTETCAALKDPRNFAPPKKEWQGLTDEERLRCFDDVDWNKVDWCPDHEQYAKAIEAKLKEKNA